MNIYILGLVSKWITILTLSVTGLFTQTSTPVKLQVKNTNQTKNATANVQIINYETTKKYNSQIPEGTEKTIEQGQNGIAYIDEETKETKIIKEPTNAIVEVGTAQIYTGKLTGYGANCEGCSGTVSCRTREGSSWNLVSDGQNYTDKEYGQVRILAAALNKFPCGTIIEVESPSLGTFTAIVLDTGGAMRQDWANGIVHMDLAFTSESSEGLYNATGSNIKFTVKRQGW